MKSRNFVWASIFLSLIILCVVWAWFNGRRSESSAVIYCDDKIIKRIDDLFVDEVQYETIRSENGYNKIAWCNGEIWVEESDCENQTCVHFGKLSSSGLSIVCAPHRLVITIEDAEDEV